MMSNSISLIYISGILLMSVLWGRNFDFALTPPHPTRRGVSHSLYQAGIRVNYPFNTSLLCVTVFPSSVMSSCEPFPPA